MSGLAPGAFGLLSTAKSAETKRIFEMIDDAKQKALGGSAMHAQMLMNLLKVEGGRETLWALTTAAQRRDIAACAKLWQAGNAITPLP